MYKVLESKSNTIVLAFGRLNPVTSGHAILVSEVLNQAKKYSADHIFFVSRTQDPKKNPLSVDQKVYYIRQSFGGLNVVGASREIRTFIEAAKSMSGKYSNLIMVAGSDRVHEFKTLLDKYNGKEFNFQTISVVSAGERDPDSDGAAGMSASKMRQEAANGNFAKFKMGCPPSMPLAVCKKMFDDVRAGMQIKEHNKMRNECVKENIFNIGDLVKYKDTEHRIIFKGPNYAMLENNQRVWLKDIEPIYESDVKPLDKIKAARIIAMALGYEDAEDKTNPSAIVNAALRIVRNKSLNPEAKKILSRMLELARKMKIDFDEKLIKEDENKDDEDNIDYTDGHLSAAEKEKHALLIHGRNPGCNYKRVRKILYKIHEQNTEITELSKETLASYTQKAIDQGMKHGDKNTKTKIGQDLASKRYAGALKAMHKTLLKNKGSGISEDKSNEEDELHFSDDELDDILSHMSDDEIIKYGYEDDDFFDDEEDEEGEEVNEVLSRIERLKAKVRMRRSKARRERGARIALKRRSSTPTIAKRSRRLAIKAIKMRLARKPLDTLTTAEKERLEMRVARMKPAISRLAIKFMPRVRGLEKSRLETNRTAG